MKSELKNLSKEQIYPSAEGLLVAVDSIIFGVRDNQLNVLLFEREVEPLAGNWSLVGSFVKKNEDVEKAASRILKTLTGLENLFMEQLYTFGNVNRDPGGRVLSIAYWSLIRIDQNNLKVSVKNHKAKWVPLNKLPKLILDHNEMVKKAIKHLREQARFHPVGFELLPKEFTLVQLKLVYEAIFDVRIDDRNFRKKILNSGLLTGLNKKDMSTSKKGSFLYSLNEERYRLLQQRGYNFDFGF
ncbi:MAG: NUDIX domain-containing protein [Bacteroidota bacterium]